MTILDPTDRDMMIRTVLGESADQGPLGMAATAHVIRNRAISGIGGTTPAAVVQAPHQFESWKTGNKFDPTSKEYSDAGTIVDAVMNGAPDPTFGATNFINKGLQTEEGRSTPQWAQGQGLKIGDHTFYNANGTAPAPNGVKMSFTDGSTTGGPLPNGGNALTPGQGGLTPGSVARPVAPPVTPPAAPAAAPTSQNSIMAVLQGLMANRQGGSGGGGQSGGPGLVSRALGGVGDAIGSSIGLGTRANPQSWFSPTPQQATPATASPIGSGAPGGQPLTASMPPPRPPGALPPGAAAPAPAPAQMASGTAQQNPNMAGVPSSGILGLLKSLFAGGMGGGGAGAGV